MGLLHLWVNFLRDFELSINTLTRFGHLGLFYFSERWSQETPCFFIYPADLWELWKSKLAIVILMSRISLAGLYMRNQLVDKPFKSIFAYFQCWPIIRTSFWAPDFILQESGRERATCRWLHVSSWSNADRRELQQGRQVYLQNRATKLHSPSRYPSKQLKGWQHLAPARLCLSASPGQSITVCSHHNRAQAASKATGF